MRNALVNTFARLRKDEKGVTLVEYGIGLVLAITVGGYLFTNLGAAVQGELTDSCGVLAASGTTNNAGC